MKLFLKRLMIVIFVPPLIGAAILTCYEFLSFEDSSLAPSLSVSLAGFLVFTIFGILYCIIPSLIFWAIFKKIQARTGEYFQSKLRCAGLGAFFGFITGYFMNIAVWPFTNGGALEPIILGMATGAVTGYLLGATYLKKIN